MRELARKPNALAKQNSPSLARPLSVAEKEARHGNDHSPASAPTFGRDFSQIPVRGHPPIRIQPKLTVGAAGDAFEQEADRIADQVMCMPEPRLQRACACGGTCGSCASAADTDSIRREPLRMKAMPASATAGIEAPPIVREVLNSPGQPLDSATRAFFEPRFGQDFSAVRVHTDARAAESASEVRAVAYTVGYDIFLGEGAQGQGSPECKKLLAHELVHTQQQSQAGTTILRKSVDPVRGIPNQGNIALIGKDYGARGYMPDEAKFKSELNAIKTLADKRKRLDDFVSEFFDHYLAISAPNEPIFEKSLNIRETSDDVDKNDKIRGIWLIDYESRGNKKEKNADWGKYKKNRGGFASMMILDKGGPNKLGLELLELRKKSYDAYLTRLEKEIDADTSGDAAAKLATAFRLIGDHVNRLYAVSKASQDTSLSFPDVMSLYGQEGYFTMPSSSGSLAAFIPSPETGGASSIGGKFKGVTYTFDFSTMNLVVPAKFANDVISPTHRQLWALGIYSLQFVGSDVIQHLLAGITDIKPACLRLARWSFENRRLGKSNAKQTVGTLAADWEKVAASIEEQTPKHRKADQMTGLDDVIAFAPKDPGTFVAFLLTEAAYLLKAYQYRSAVLFGQKDRKFSSSLAYMMYNGTNIKNDYTVKKLISDAAQGAKQMADNPESLAMTTELRDQLKTLKGTSKHTSFEAVSLWVEGNAKRWDLLMDFMEKAGQTVEADGPMSFKIVWEWNPWVNVWNDKTKQYNKVDRHQQQVNASNFRTLSEFYRKVMEQTTTPPP